MAAAMKTMRMRRAYIGAAIALLAITANASITWTTDLDAAKRRARDEKKLILLVTKSAQKLLADAEQHEAVVHSLDDFVLVRGDAGAPLRFLDPAGELIVSPKFLPDVNYFAAMLVKMRVETPAIVDASERRRAGRTAEADLIVGNAYLELELSKQALERFERAAKTLREQHDRVGAQFAEINAGFAYYVSGHRGQGIQILDGAIRSPETNDNAAEAWYLLGSIRRIERNGRDAIAAFRKAWDLATPDSAVAAVAHAALEALDKRPIPPKPGASTAIVRVIPPPRKVVTGSVEFIAEVDRPAAAVDFYLDDVKLATAKKTPFATRINVGNIPRARSVKAIALDARGIPIGEASTTINDRADAFHVTITSPATEVVSGDVTIEADAHVPDNRRL